MRSGTRSAHPTSLLQWFQRGNAEATGTDGERLRSTFEPVTDTVALKQVWEQSADQMVVLFQHDPYCPISARAYREMTNLGASIRLVDVSADHEVSEAVEAETGVRHESPQVLVLWQGRAVWNASHYAITTDAVRHVLVAPMQVPGRIIPTDEVLP